MSFNYVIHIFGDVFRSRESSGNFVGVRELGADVLGVVGHSEVRSSDLGVSAVVVQGILHKGGRIRDLETIGDAESLGRSDHMSLVTVDAKSH